MNLYKITAITFSDEHLKKLEDELNQIWTELNEWSDKLHKLRKSKVSFIEVMPDKLLLFHMDDGSATEYKWTQTSRKDVWTPEIKEKARIKMIISINHVFLFIFYR